MRAAACADVVARYLDALGTAGPARDALEQRLHARAGVGADDRALFVALHAALADEDADPDNPARASVAARMALAAHPQVPPPPAPGEGKGWLPT